MLTVGRLCLSAKRMMAGCYFIALPGAQCMMFWRLSSWTFLTCFRLVKSNRASQNADPSLRLMFYVLSDSKHWSLLLPASRYSLASPSAKLIVSG